MRPICAQDAEAMTPEQKEQALATIATEQLVLDRKIAELVFWAHAEGPERHRAEVGHSPLGGPEPGVGDRAPCRT